MCKVQVFFIQIIIKYLIETPIIKDQNAEKTSVLCPCQLCPPVRQGQIQQVCVIAICRVHTIKDPLLCNTTKVEYSSIFNKAYPYHHDITELLLKVAWNTINHQTYYSINKFTEIEFRNDNIFFPTFGWRLYQEDRHPYWYQLWSSSRKKKNVDQSYNFTFSYIEYVFSFNNLPGDYVDCIFLVKLR